MPQRKPGGKRSASAISWPLRFLLGDRRCRRRGPRGVDQFDAGFGEEGAAVLVRVVAGVDHPPHARVDEHLGAGDAGLVGDVGAGPLGAHAMQRGLDDGVLLGVQRAHAVAVDHQVADIIAVGRSDRRAVVAGGENAPVAHQHGPDVRPIAGAALGHGEGDIHEVVVPARTLVRGHPLVSRL